MQVKCSLSMKVVSVLVLCRPSNNVMSCWQRLKAIIVCLCSHILPRAEDGLLRAHRGILDVLQLHNM